MRGDFDRSIKLEIHSAKVSSGGGLLTLSRIDEVLQLTAMARDGLPDCRTSDNSQRGRVGPWIKEGKHLLNWTRLSCHDFVDNQVRLHLSALAYNLASFLRRLVMPDVVTH